MKIRNTLCRQYPKEPNILVYSFISKDLWAKGSSPLLPDGPVAPFGCLVIPLHV
jgi:hypothetical protein